MVAVYGLNILAQFVGDRGALLNWIDRAQPSACVVMDDISLAQAVRIASPDTTVVYRAYNSHDHHWHEVTTPVNWLTAHRQYSAGGNVLQVFNEVHGYQDLRPIARWCAELMTLAARENIRLCLPNWGVGHPDVPRIYGGELDELWQAFDRFPQHIYGVHEYAVYSTIDERPYRIGRFLESLARMDKLGLARPHIIVTESGRDIGGGPNDGWRAVFSETDYADFLYGLKDFYAAYNVSACIFCYGRGANGQWQSFDVEGAGTLLSRLAEFNQSIGGGTGQMVKVYKVGAIYSLNVRRERVIANNVVGSVAPNEVVQLVKVSGGWVEIIKANGVRGVVSEQAGLVTIEGV